DLIVCRQVLIGNADIHVSEIDDVAKILAGAIILLAGHDVLARSPGIIGATPARPQCRLRSLTAHWVGDPLDLRELLRRQSPFRRMDVLIDLLRGGCPGDHACNNAIAQEPAECELEQNMASARGKGGKALNNAPVTRIDDLAGVAGAFCEP